MPVAPPVDGRGLAPPLEGATAPGVVVAGGAVVAADVVEVVLDAVDVVTAALADAPVGTVSGGAPLVSEVVVPLPHATSPRARTSPTMNAAILVVTRVMAGVGRDQEPSGSIRRPQVGQSLRSFWAS